MRLLFTARSFRAVLVPALLFPSVLVATNAGAAPQRLTPEVWHPTLVQFKPAGETALEVGSALSPAGYEKLKKALKWEAGKQRTDVYYDGFDGKRFLLKTSELPLKVRVKMKAKGPVWQVSRFVSKDVVKVGPLRIKVHVTESWEDKLKGDEARAFTAATDAFFDRLEAGGAPLRAAGQQVHQAFLALKADDPLDGWPAVAHYLAKRPFTFMPTKRTPNKQRLEATLAGFTDAVVTLQLGREDERDPQGKPFTAYELEAEADRPLSAAQATKLGQAVGALMAKAGLVPADQETPTGRAWAYTTAQLLKP